MTVIEPQLSRLRHALWEDALAIPIGAFVLSWGVFLLDEMDGVSGGLAGVAFVAHYLSGWPVGVLIFLVNVPFYWLAVRRLGWRFTVKTLLAVALISFGAGVHHLYIDVASLQPLYAAVFAGLSIGTGMLVLFRHGASAGGFGILAAYAQERFTWRAGYVQGALDLVVIAAAVPLVDGYVLLCSVVGTLVLNLVIAINHRPGRYRG